MGCDFFYEGNLPNVMLQEKVVNFVKDYFSKVDLVITPDTACKYSTEINLPSIGLRYNPREEHQEEYPFNFFGIIPDCYDEHGISDHGQFVFNRNDNGRLVRIKRLPDSMNILPHHYYQERREVEYVNTERKPQLILGRLLTGEELWLHDSLPRRAAPYKYQIVINDGGYHRVGGGLGFALLLTICKLRWWPGLKMSDDYENCEIVEALITKCSLESTLRDENNDFAACYNLFISEYEREFPPLPPAEAEDIRMQARQYLDFMEKIKPYMKSKEEHE